MKIQQIRNATIRIECAGKHFLVDPWFQKKGTGMSAPSPDPEGTNFDGVILIRTEAMHGESPDHAAGPVCGIILQAAGEPVLYVAGDTVYYKGVERALEQYRPDVVVLNACGAELMGLGRLIMGAEDVLKVCEAAPDAAIIASHMDAVNHATVNRTGLRDFLRKHGKDGRVSIPEDGECLEFSGT